MKQIYLDWAATAIPDINILKDINRIALTYFANPSSVHDQGLKAGAFLMTCRNKMAKILNVPDDQLIFTSGGSESNNLVLFSLLEKLKIDSILKYHPRIIISGIEHPSMYEPARTLSNLGFTLDFIRTGKNGIVIPDDLEAKLTKDTVLVSVILVNNETGAVQPIKDLTKIVREYSKSTGRYIHIHTDAVQALGKIPFSIPGLGMDSASFSAHKIRGPRGVGALYLKDIEKVIPLYSGGGQEKNIRPGTENLPGIYGFFRSSEKSVPAVHDNISRMYVIAGHFLKELKEIKNVVIIPEDRLNSESSQFSPYIISAAFPPVPSEVTVRALSEKGIMISAGSACSTHNSLSRGRVLKNMGYNPELRSSAVRFSFGNTTTEDEIDTAISVIRDTIPRLISIAGA